MAIKTLGVGVVATVIAALLSVSVMSQTGWDVTVFAAFGVDSHEINEYAGQSLDEFYLRPFQGHDGKFFFVQSNDPWVRHPEINASVLDRPLYRSQRMLYPVLAGGGGLFTPEMIVWALLIVNIVGMGLGSWAAAAVATTLGGSPWWGLSFVLNIGFISEMNIDGAGIVAAAAAFAAVVAFSRGRTSWGLTVLVLGVLAREAMLLVAAGIALWMWIHNRRKDALLSLAVPTMAVAVWGLYLRLQLGWESGVSQVQEIGLPFVGFIESIPKWLDDPLDLFVATAVLTLLAVFARRAIVSRELVGFAFLGFVVLGIVFTAQVWRSYFDITRAVAPIITTFVLLAFARHRSSSNETVTAEEGAAGAA
jgi:hypothetical protein